MINNYTEANANRGNEAVHEFAELVLKLKPDAKIVYSTIQQDKHEHWDIEIDGVKHDIKDNMTFDRQGRDCIVIEIMNNWGDRGSLFGIADRLTYKFYDTFISIERKALVEYNKTNSRRLVEDKRDAVGNYYRRTHENKLDLIALVPIDNITNLITQYYIE